MYTHSSLKSLPAEKKAEIKERENLIRFETHALLRGIEANDEMRERVKEACLAFYKTNLGEITVPSDVLIESGFGAPKGVELNV